TPGRAVSRRTPARTGWSRSALEALGVPDAVLAQLPDPAPRDDLAWVVALAAAIEAVVPAPAEPDEAHPVVVSGHGLAGALAVLDAGTRGASPGTISHAGRTAPATATELALVLRHHVDGRGA
ncbi:MAG: hypothetical protein JWN17_415, partial [Frankiales bacterium]|nr:hypothetical protein [Frankiales bacterium]